MKFQKERIKKKSRSNIFRDKDSEFSKKQPVVLNTHFRCPANPKEDKENYIEEHNNKRLKNEDRNLHRGLNKTDYSLKDILIADSSI